MTEKDQLEWREAITAFEENKASRNVRYALFGDGAKPEDLPPWYTEFLQIIILCLRTAYVNAYGYDNLTAQLYYEFSHRLSEIWNKQTPDQLRENRVKLEKLLEHIPGEFPEYEAISGLLSTATGKGLTIPEFLGLLEYLNSVQCDKDFMAARHP